ncbi:phosphatidylinositol 3-kinase VPS34 [Cyberlindnera jadinii NRRL Y-1542]|uniref:Phosphatidylinositol 3-kinase VPS34 n=1 Tax=Cyberlindnera jadinii (strain ATCC 18201 / CBS 1600 / BCRC 20928 / JCM 3617 / NBRC 0987 / NRRL Y-1542) TaxID=983966 RepID=A0A1E4S4L1_CYBJN|nr:phosphatidylinositol 3-kinase [Cyberlindnera jadinii NRRL Y-1542]ODV74469.1 phosphatidylinositol 3-kinase [Cyberlindnera jadinii NRRL Y-1542]
MTSKSVTYCTSRGIDVPLRVRINSLEGTRPLLKESTRYTDPSKVRKLSNFSQTSGLFCSVVVTLEGKPLTIPVTTSYAAFRASRRWNEWLTLPINVSQLPFNSKLTISIWEFDGDKRSDFGETDMYIFHVDDDCTLKRGRQKLTVRCQDPSLNHGHFKDGQMAELELAIKKHENGDMVAVEWLDNLTFRTIEQINKSQSAQPGFTLFIDMVQFDVPVVFSDHKYPPPMIPTYQPSDQQLQQMQNEQQGTLSKISTGKFTTMKVYDPEQYRTDPIEQKYRKLERSHKDGPFDREIKPTPKIRDELNKILNYSSVQELTQYEKNLVWKFRYFLLNNKKGLNKLIKSVNFSDENELNEALNLLPKWVEIDIEDSIELLGPNFKNSTVRTYAVERLKKAHDDELELYLLQLVQALRYETLTNSSSDFSIVGLNESMLGGASSSGSVLDDSQSLTPLSQFLVERALLNERLGSFLYWYLNTEARDNNPGSIYRKLLDYFLKSVKNQGLQREIELVDHLVKLCTKIKASRETTPKKIEMLQSILETKFKTFSPTRLPLDPSVEICGTVPEESFVFKSSLSPLKVTFTTTDGGKYPLMFKVGDDLRQDQLVIQIILLMNKLLLNENVDLKLSPYKILATGPTEGAIQFIPNSTLASVLADYHGILPYLKHHNPDSSNELGVVPSVIDTFVKSCAGYCVITYILGVGDRHLDNLLICPDGHFFHADFGYILGQDPKPFPPLMKLPPQIIDAFGGADSPNYDKFRDYCFVAYTILRKNSNLILNLFELMRDSSIPDIKMEPDRAVYKVKEKFCLDMSEEEAIIHFQNLINDSVSALLPMVIDRLHSLAQYWRA